MSERDRRDRPQRKPLAEPEVDAHAEETMAASDTTTTSTSGEESRARRPHRVPVGQADRLRYSQRPGYYRRVVNDDPENPGRIQAHLDAGYEFVTGDETGGPVTAGDPSKITSGVSKHVGGGIIGRLMELPEEYRREDEERKNRLVDESEAAMKRNMVGGPGRYGKVSVNEKTDERRPG